MTTLANALNVEQDLNVTGDLVVTGGGFAINAALPAGTNNIGDVDVLSLPALPAGTNNIGDVDVLSLPALPAGTNNIGDVDVLSLPALPAGTNNIGDVDVLTLPALVAGSALIGKVGIDQTTVGTTNAVDAQGRAATTNPSAASDGAAVRAMHDKVGRIVTTPGQVRELTGIQATTITSGSETTIVTAVASTYLDLTHLSITNSSATGVTATLKDSTGGTTRAIHYIPATGGIVLTFPTPIAQASVNSAWSLTMSTGVSSIYVVACYNKNI